MFAKMVLFMIIFAGNMYYQIGVWKDERPKTLYDLFDISRMASFEEIKAAKDDYLEKLKMKDDPENEESLDLIEFTMTKEEVADSFNVLTHFLLKEMYDKHNLFYSQTDFETHK